MKAPAQGTAGTPESVGRYRYILYGVNAAVLLAAVAFLERQRWDYQAVTEQLEGYHVSIIAGASAIAEELDLVEDALGAHALKLAAPASVDEEPFHVALPGVSTALHLLETELAQVTETQDVFLGPVFAAPTDRVERQFLDFKRLISGGLHQRSEVEAAQKQMQALVLSVEQLRRLHKLEHAELSNSLPAQHRQHLSILIVVVLGLLAISIGATHRISKFIAQAGERLRESEERYRDLYENAPTAYVSVDTDGRILRVNHQTTELLGYTVDELVGRPTLDLYADTPAGKEKAGKILQRFIAGERVEDEELQMRHTDGHVLWVGLTVDQLRDSQGEIVESRSIVIDITERKRAEEERASVEAQLRQQQRLETIGTLAGGIAHDFNNILTPILGYTGMALDGHKENDPVFEDLQHVLKAAKRARDLVMQILLFAKEGEKEAAPIHLQPTIKEALQLLRPSIPSTITIRERIDSSCGFVRADGTQIFQVIVNLCTNAWQAMAGKGGILTIELVQIKVGPGKAGTQANLAEGDYVRMSVADTGVGMDHPTLERIFEPFYTTKAVDEGTGLGLSVVHGIVRSHQGEIIAESTPGEGSVFHVYLPVVEATESPAAVETKVASGGQESILLVDDDEAVANVKGRMLTELGYKVQVCHSGRDALEAFREKPEAYDLLISDLTMPGMTGLDLSEKLQTFRSGFPIIIMTGYGNSMNEDTRRAHGVRQVIAKPVGMGELASTVRGVLDA